MPESWSVGIGSSSIVLSRCVFKAVKHTVAGPSAAWTLTRLEVHGVQVPRRPHHSRGDVRLPVVHCSSEAEISHHSRQVLKRGGEGKIEREGG